MKNGGSLCVKRGPEKASDKAAAGTTKVKAANRECMDEAAVSNEYSK